MGHINIKKIALGVILIILSGISLLAAFYSLEVKPGLVAKEQATLKKLKASEAQIRRRVKDIQKTKTEGLPTVTMPPTGISKAETPKGEAPVGAPLKEEDKEPVISLKTLAEEAEDVYGPEETRRQEGLLWVDRKSSKLIITLGAMNGLLPGKQLTLYDGDKEIGQVAVDLALDVVSFVHPIPQSLELLQNNYYRVVAE
ncbi:MAG TPA: hypothetical protein DD723_02625 [Candidatus Omnitrophica bacterium]|nr:MAG: hypothetical protein A2Z81_01655 [Omnitrophica WOR_2 bacterium GWA2_45_18]HBR14421.1 hypothetical protein [Candidatus Omnitrophota bacterium]